MKLNQSSAYKKEFLEAKNSGNKLMDSGKFQEAIDFYQQALEVQSQSQDVQNFFKILKYLGSAQFKAGKNQEAIKTYLQLISLSPDQPSQVYKNLAQFFNSSNDLDLRCRIYEEAIDSSHQNAAYIYEYIGEKISKYKSKNLAVKFFVKAVRRQPDNFWHYYNLANVLAKKNKFKSAIKLYYQAIQLDNSFYGVYNNLGKVFFDQDHLREAVKYCIKALEKVPNTENCPSLWNFLKRCWRQLSAKQLKRLTEACYAAIDRIPESHSAIRLSYLSNLSKILTYQGMMPEVITCHHQASYHTTLISNPEFISQYPDLNWETDPRRDIDFLIIGVMKCGTTAIYNYLSQHPKVLPSVRKEVNFFQKYKRGAASLEWYLSHFPPQKIGAEHYLTGEASPTYIRTPGVEESVFELFPKTKIIIAIRNPVSRVLSQYALLTRSEREKYPFNKIIELEMKQYENMEIDEIVRKATNPKYYIPQSLYIYFIERWMKWFPKEQVCILMCEDLIKKPLTTMNTVYSFLGLPTLEICDNESEPHKPRSHSHIDENIISRLKDFFQPHNQRLEEYLGKPLNW